MAFMIRPTDESAEAILTHLSPAPVGNVEVEHRFCPGQPLRVDKTGNTAVITYGCRVELFRGLGLLAENKDQEEYHTVQKARFSTDGVMLDCSRNGVISVAAAKHFIRRMALMGLDMLMLYTEDTYEIPEYPYFGYMRGRYSMKELRELDHYASSFGITLVPCIQTLAHLQGMLRWPCFEDIHDCNDILLCDEEKTYELIEAMIRTCRAAFTSNRIHIGMDEAFMMGFGQYRFTHDSIHREEIFCRHLERVCRLCESYGFQPMIWSDMFFRMAFHGEYKAMGEVAPEVIRMVPENVELVYWDYYQHEKEPYLQSIESHQKFSNKMMFAGGAWRWIGFAPALEKSLFTSRLALEACVEKNVEEVLLTAWGDNGNEASFFSILPVMQLFAEMNYVGNVSDQQLSARLKACTGETLEDMLLLDLPNRPDGKLHNSAANPAKYLFYQDVLGGLLEKHTEECYPSHYAEAAVYLREAADRSEEFGYMYRMLAELCSVLEIKSRVGTEAQEAYLAGDKKGLEKIARVTLPELLVRLDAFHRALEAQWTAENKVFGYEVLDIRVGGIKARVHTAVSRLERYLAGTLERLEELEEERLYFDCRTDDEENKVMCYNLWMPVASANLI